MASIYLTYRNRFESVIAPNRNDSNRFNALRYVCMNRHWANDECKREVSFCNEIHIFFVCLLFLEHNRKTESSRLNINSHTHTHAHILRVNTTRTYINRFTAWFACRVCSNFTPIAWMNWFYSTGPSVRLVRIRFAFYFFIV